MKKLVVISSIIGLVLISSSWVSRIFKSAGPPSCHAGEPPNNTSCIACHDDGTVNTGLAQIVMDLDGAENGYVPGNTYTITVSVSRADMQRAGFQIIALQDDDIKISPGTFTLTDPVRTQILDKNTPHPGGCLEEERVWIEHTYAGNSSNDSGISEWSYQWQAPAADVGPITFYLAALEANNDLSETGDQVYTRKETISALTNGIATIRRTNSFVVYPLPAGEKLNIEVKNTAPNYISLTDYSGTKVWFWTGNKLTNNNGVISLSLADIAAGMYLLNIQSNGVSEKYKVIVMR